MADYKLKCEKGKFQKPQKKEDKPIRVYGKKEFEKLMNKIGASRIIKNY